MRSPAISVDGQRHRQSAASPRWPATTATPGRHAFRGRRATASPGRQLVIAIANNNLGSPSGTIILRRGRQARAGRLLRDHPFDPSQRHRAGDDRHAGKYGHRFGRGFGPVPLAKDGIGTLILTNVNSQTGGAVIDAGDTAARRRHGDGNAQRQCRDLTPRPAGVRSGQCDDFGGAVAPATQGRSAG